MSIGQNSSSNGSTEFLNFSDALNHLRWGDRIARRGWVGGKHVAASYDSNCETGLIVKSRFSNIRSSLYGQDIMAEDWYVLGENQ